MRKWLAAVVAALLAGVGTPPSAAYGEDLPAPRIAAHQHLISPEFSKIIREPPMDGAALLDLLDRADIRRGVVLSMGYSFGDERKGIADPDSQTRRENDWTSQQVAASRGRLVGFCSVNPLREAAMAEIDRCLGLPGMAGLKLHFGNSGVSLRDPATAQRLQDVFSAANAHGAAIIVHLRSRTGTAYGREDAQLFLDRVLPRAPDVTVQVAHLAGSSGFPDDAELSMDVFANAIARGDPRTRRLIFDATTVVADASTPADGERVARMLRRVGLRRVVFGSDMPVGGNPPPAEAWAILRAKVPLTAAEVRTLAANVPPYAAERTARSSAPLHQARP